MVSSKPILDRRSHGNDALAISGAYQAKPAMRAEISPYVTQSISTPREGVTMWIDQLPGGQITLRVSCAIFANGVSRQASNRRRSLAPKNPFPSSFQPDASRLSLPQNILLSFFQKSCLFCAVPPRH